MDRVVVDRSFTLYKTFYEGGTATDPDGDPTVVVVRSDGSTVATGAVTNEAAAGTWSVTVPASSNDLLDTLTATWTADVNGEDQTYVDFIEVVGRFLFTIAEARLLKPLDNTTTYPESKIVEMRTTVEQALEDACGVAFVPRYALETLPTEYPGLLVSNPKVRSVRSATDGTTPLTQDQIDALTFTGRTIYGLPWVPWDYSTWSGARVSVTIGYEHGYTYPPERVRRASLILARSWLVSGPVDDRASTLNAGADGGTYSLVTPGRGGSIFGLPEVDAVVQEYGQRITAP